MGLYKHTSLETQDADILDFWTLECHAQRFFTLEDFRHETVRTQNFIIADLRNFNHRPLHSQDLKPLET